MPLCLLLAACQDRGRAEEYMIEETLSEEDFSEDISVDVAADSEHGQDMIYVHVCGCVVDPGVYELEKGARGHVAVEAAGGFLEGVTRVFVAGARNTMRLVASTVGAGLFLNLSTADQYISIILTGNMFRNAYRESGHEARLLSRTVEDAVTVTSPLIPWNSCGMTQATVLGVSTWTYLPYCVFNYVCPLMSLVVAAIGYKIVRKALPVEVEGAS